MADQYGALDKNHRAFIEKQHMYFTGTAGAEGYVNVSPKGMDSFRILDDKTVAWLNLTGSGNETAAHVLENGRMTIMFCSFLKQPLILRLYGQAEGFHPRDDRWPELAALFPDELGARNIFVLNIDLVQTSCGYAVPYYSYKGQRPTLTRWAERHGESGIRDYWAENNTESLDGRHTGIFEDSPTKEEP